MISVVDEGVKYHFIKLLAALKEINFSFLIASLCSLDCVIVLFQINKMFLLFLIFCSFLAPKKHLMHMMIVKCEENAGHVLEFLFPGSSFRL